MITSIVWSDFALTQVLSSVYKYLNNQKKIYTLDHVNTLNLTNNHCLYDREHRRNHLKGKKINVIITYECHSYLRRSSRDKPPEGRQKHRIYWWEKVKISNFILHDRNLCVVLFVIQVEETYDDYRRLAKEKLIENFH